MVRIFHRAHRPAMLRRRQHGRDKRMTVFRGHHAHRLFAGRRTVETARAIAVEGRQVRRDHRQPCAARRDGVHGLVSAIEKACRHFASS